MKIIFLIYRKEKYINTKKNGAANFATPIPLRIGVGARSAYEPAEGEKMLEQKDVMVICRKCKNSVPSGIMRMDLDDKIMVCQTCLSDKKKSLSAKSSVTSPEKASGAAGSSAGFSRHGTVQAMAREPSSTAHARDKQRYKCGKCHFAFNINVITAVPKNCPYCGKQVDY